MNASFYMPTRVFFGENALMNNRSALLLGKHALIVTGKTSAKASGALDDVTAVLDEFGITYTIFDKIQENPPLMTCFEGGKLAAEVGADFVIGIGGGSPLDAAKAIAAFAANQDIEPMDIYDDKKRKNPTLPLIAIPAAVAAAISCSRISGVKVAGACESTSQSSLAAKSAACSEKTVDLGER